MADEKCSRGCGKPTHRGACSSSNGKSPAPAKTKKESARPAQATQEDWELFAFSVANLSNTVSLAIHARNPNFPVDEEWQERLATATVRMAQKYAGSFAAYSVEFNFVMAWGGALALAFAPNISASVDIGKMVRQRKLAKNPPPAPQEAEQPEAGPEEPPESPASEDSSGSLQEAQKAIGRSEKKK